MHSWRPNIQISRIYTPGFGLGYWAITWLFWVSVSLIINWGCCKLHHWLELETIISLCGPTPSPSPTTRELMALLLSYGLVLHSCSSTQFPSFQPKTFLCFPSSHCAVPISHGFTWHAFASLLLPDSFLVCPALTSIEYKTRDKSLNSQNCSSLMLR